mmetsp:Transcript_18540/g.62118  ORF Transcript_18540/g.62118 Transcript_18540/m.62118 type:complete len:252 (+) Transcript_18540:1351-2106(+)
MVPSRPLSGTSGKAQRESTSPVSSPYPRQSCARAANAHGPAAGAAAASWRYTVFPRMSDPMIPATRSLRRSAQSKLSTRRVSTSWSHTSTQQSKRSHRTVATEAAPAPARTPSSGMATRGGRSVSGASQGLPSSGQRPSGSASKCRRRPVSASHVQAASSRAGRPRWPRGRGSTVAVSTASLSLALLSAWALSSAARDMLVTTSPPQSTKVPWITFASYTSRRASPGLKQAARERSTDTCMGAKRGATCAT